MYMRLLISVLLVAATVLINGESDVVVLDSSNFEHLTQASSGMTTGDWMVEFYAPWCGHCKNLAPTFEEVATELKGEVNVAKVDAAKERAIGSRFEIRGFPTILFLSHGQVYKYKGKRTKEALVEFAKGGYKTKVDEAQPIPEPKSALQEFTSIFTKAWSASMKDMQRGKFFTPNVLTVVMPTIFMVLMAIIVCIPVASEPKRTRRVARKPVNATTSVDANEPETDKDK